MDKDSTILELYGTLEEAAARTVLAAQLLREKGRAEEAERLARLHQAIRLLAGAVAGYAKPGKAARLVEEAAEGLDQPTTWTNPCSVEAAELMLAASLLLKADRLTARLARERQLTPSTAHQVSQQLHKASYTMHTIIQARLCPGTPGR